jgi:hypothetical protein
VEKIAKKSHFSSVDKKNNHRIFVKEWKQNEKMLNFEKWIAFHLLKK